MRRIAAIALTLLAPSMAVAGPVGWRYEVMWGGFHAGDMAITRDDSSPATETRLSLRTVGLFKAVFPFDFDAEGVSLPDTAEGLRSEHYQTRFVGRYEDRLLRTEYDPKGEAKVVRDEALAVFKPWPAGDTPNPPVPPELKRGVMDPLTNMAMAGWRAAEAAAKGERPSFRNVSFDGKRAYAIDTRVVGPHRITMRERDYDTLLVTMTLHPLAGFKPKFLSLWDGAEYEVDVDPVTRLPLRIRSESFTSYTVFNALAPCTVPAAGCLPPVE